MNELVQAYYQQPVHQHKPSTISVSRHEWNSICGDHITVYLNIDNNYIIDWWFDGDTSLITTAAASCFGDIVIGKHIEDILTWWESIMIEVWFEVSSRRRRARIIPLLATQNAIYEYLHQETRHTFDTLLT